MTEASGDKRGVNVNDEETVGSLNPIEKTARKARARITRREEFEAKKEAALTSQSLKEIGRENSYKFSVSFPSGIRRASSLTSSLALRLGPPPPTVLAPAQTVSLDEKDEDCGHCCGDQKTEDSSVVRCPECAMFLPRRNIVRHIRSTCRLVPCTLCGCLLLPASRELHVQETCRNRLQCCHHCCGKAMTMREFARHHLKEDCGHRAAPCSACEEICFADELQEHKANSCPERELQCSSCGMGVPARNLPDHVAQLCPNLMWKCPCGKDSLPLAKRLDHLKKCDAFIDAWEASIEQVIARAPKIEVIRNIGKVMISTHMEDPALALLALAESGGNASSAAKKIAHERHYLDELHLAVDTVNTRVFLESLQKPKKRGAGSLWRAGM